jgi:clan AA aspartic protease
MIRGQVTPLRQAVIPLQLQGLNGQIETIDAVIDTGFDGSLALPPDLVLRLELPFGMTRSLELGDGSHAPFDIHRVTILWDGQEREVAALVTTGGPLVGMSLLRGCKVSIAMVEGGEVLIEPRP